MGAMRPDMAELECCPQCAGRMLEALDAAGVDCCTPETGDCDCCGEGCGCGQARGCAQPGSSDRNPSG